MLRAYLVEDIEKVVRALQKEGYLMVDDKELFRRLNPIEAAQHGLHTDVAEGSALIDRTVKNLASASGVPADKIGVQADVCPCPKCGGGLAHKPYCPDSLYTPDDKHR